MQPNFHLTAFSWKSPEAPVGTSRFALELSISPGHSSGVAQFWPSGNLEHLMKTRRLVALCALLGALTGSDVSSSADEKLNRADTSLGNTTIGGYVDSTAGGPQLPSPGWTGAWPPMPAVDETAPHAPPSLPPQPPQYPFPSPPEIVLPDYGVYATTFGLTPTPEPATYSLLLMGGVAGWLMKRKGKGSVLSGQVTGDGG